jgi:hypothetical protein
MSHDTTTAVCSREHHAERFQKISQDVLHGISYDGTGEVAGRDAPTIVVSDHD